MCQDIRKARWTISLLVKTNLPNALSDRLIAKVFGLKFKRIIRVKYIDLKTSKVRKAQS